MTLLVAGLVFLLAAFVQGLSGFGSGLVAMGLLPLFWDLEQAVAVSSVFGVMLNLSLAWKLRAHARPREVAPMVLAALAGVPVGLWFLHSVDPRLVKGALGLVLVSHAVFSLSRPAAGAMTTSRPVAALAGLVGGALSGAFNTSGPPVLVYATLRGWPPATFKANLQAYIGVTALTSMTGFALTGLITRETLQANLLLAPALIAGGVLGHRASRHIDQALFRRGVLVALLFMGAWYLSGLIR